MRAERRLRAVIDTNVWISAALSPQGTPARLVRRLLQTGEVVFSELTFLELQTRLWKPKFDPYIGTDTRQRLLHDLDAAAIWVDLPESLRSRHWSRDPDDDVFIQTALAAQADWLVTGDADLLTITGLTPPPLILSPADAWARAEAA